MCHDVSIARTGVMDYGPGETPIPVGKSGVTKITREEKQVFRPETIASFEGKSVTINHPKEFVSPENWGQLTKGTVQNVRREHDDLVADLLITDKIAIQLVKNGLREVSCGYEAEYIETGDGTGNQENIIGNHVALVDQGRAGSSYAINDHKGDFKMKLKSRIQSIFAKAQDDAMKAADDESGPEVTAKNVVAKDDHGKGYDELVKTVKDLGEKVAAMKPKESKDDKAGEAAGGSGEVVADDEDGDLEKRLAMLEEGHKKMETMLEKILEHVGDDMTHDEEEHEEHVTDDDEEEEHEESEDDDYKESGMTGDAKSRAEILAPGIAKGKDIKVKALKAYYETKDGKKIITAMCGGKKPDFKSAKTVDTLFVAASEALKATRKSQLKSTKVNDYSADHGDAGPMTAEQMNERNAKFYNLK